MPYWNSKLPTRCVTAANPTTTEPRITESRFSIDDFKDTSIPQIVVSPLTQVLQERISQILSAHYSR